MIEAMMIIWRIRGKII